MQFKLWIEAVDRDVYYHVTYWKNLNSIALRGLVKNARPNFTGRHDLAQNSQQGLFLANQSVRHWVDVLENWADHNSESIRKDGVIPIVLRVRAFNHLTKPDNYPGNPEGSYVYPRNIHAQHLEMWDGKQWTTNISRQAVDLNLFIEKDGHPGEGSWWIFRQPYPYPPEIK